MSLCLSEVTGNTFNLIQYEERKPESQKCLFWWFTLMEVSEKGDFLRTSTSNDLLNNHSRSKERSIGQRSIVFVIRAVILAVSFLCFLYNDVLQNYLDVLWEFISNTWIYKSVYFETWCVTLCYALLTLVPLVMDRMPWFDCFKIHPSVRYAHMTVMEMLIDGVVYVSPLMFLDTFKIKRYPGVEAGEFRIREEYWLQTTRPLPKHSLSPFQFLFQLGGSILLFDIMFFVIHYCFHRSHFLYKYIHRYHHKHDVIYCHVTNQLTIPERLALILSANEALKILQSHPLTRTFFIPVFIWMLIENHSGYDLPWGPHWVIPFGLYGGPVKHYFHHRHGSKYYQPFFSYIDQILDGQENKRKKKSNVECEKLK